MKGFFIFITFLIGSFYVLFSPVALANPTTNEPVKLLILKSKNSPHYDKTIIALTATFAAELSFTIKNINDKTLPSGAMQVITLGSKAAQVSRTLYPKSHKIFSFLTLQQSQKLGLKNHETHLLIEQSTQLYLAFASTLLPHKKIGILYQKQNGTPITTFGNEIYSIKIRKQSNLIDATNEVIKNAGVLLALPNKNIYNRHTLKGILLSTFHNGTPLISYSPAHVKAGALAAIYASPNNLAQQISDTIKADNFSADTNPSRHYAQYFSLKFNQRVAQSLGITLKTSREISRLIKERLRHE